VTLHEGAYVVAMLDYVVCDEGAADWNNSVPRPFPALE